MKLWIDVEDLFHYANYTKRLSGIQRLAFELQAALAEIAPEAVNFIRHAKSGRSFDPVDRADLEALLAGLTGYEPEDFVELPPEVLESFEAEAAQHEALPTPATSMFLRLRHQCRALLPERLHPPAILVYIKFAEAFHTLKSFIDTAISPPVNVTKAAQTAAPVIATIPVLEAEPELPSPEPPNQVRAGDWLIVLGAPWSRYGYTAWAERQCQRYGLRLALLVHDIIPLRRPEWCYHNTRLAFAECFHGLAPLADVIFTVSQHTADDVNRYAPATGLRLRRQAMPIPLGTGFGVAPLSLRNSRLPPPGSFVLMVSTIEARKNHTLAFRIWRSLTETMPLDQIPTLVFAGRTGWLVQDLMQQLENADWLNGKIMLIESPSDAELAALYEDCLFTLFPSFYEGWGLPVTESLAHGAPCLASNRTSIPEAGGSLARYFDPDNLAGAIRAVLDIIENPDQLKAWRARIAAEFRPVPWTISAAALMARLQAFDAGPDLPATPDHEVFTAGPVSQMT